MNTLKGKHSPIPWILKYTDEENCEYDINSPDGECVYSCESYYPSGISNENSEFIVKAVNNHYALLEACKLLLEYMKEDWPKDLDHPAIKKGCDLAKQVIKKAEE